MTHVFEAETLGVIVRAGATYLPERSDPEENRFSFLYRIEIVNGAAHALQLYSRRWEITDGRGAVEVVEGLGVVGEQPRIEPGAAYAYVSGATLRTPTGLMTGAYRMVADDGESFEAAIPTFSLDQPEALTRPN